MESNRGVVVNVTVNVAVASIGRLGSVNHTPRPLLRRWGFPVKWQLHGLGFISVWRGVDPDKVSPIALAFQARPYALVARRDVFITLVERYTVSNRHVT